MAIINPSNKKFDIIVLAGQSNAESSGIGRADNEWRINERIKILKGKFSATVQKTEYGNDYLSLDLSKDYYIENADERTNDQGQKCAVLALPFAKSYLENDIASDRDILIIHAAVGGTGFAKNHWGINDILFKRMVDMTKSALAMNSENRVKVLLWHQGEHDAYEFSDMSLQDKEKKHIENLDGFIKKFRDFFGKDIPFVCAGFTKSWHEKYLEQNLAIIRAIEYVCDNNKNATFISETHDLSTNADVTGSDDYVHFSRQSINTLGKRYYAAFKNMQIDK